MPSSAGTVSRGGRVSTATTPPVPVSNAPGTSPPPAAAVPAAPVVDPQLQRNYENMVSDLVKQYRSTTTSQLEFYYAVGTAANALENEAGRNTYGEATVDQLAKDLQDQTGRELGRSSIYSAKNFASKFEKSDVPQLVAANWSLRNVLFLTAEAVSDKLRKEIVREVNNKQLDQKDVQKRIKAEVKPKPTRGRKVTKPASELKRVLSSASSFVDRLSGLDKAIVLVTKVKDENERKDLKVAVGETVKGLKALRKDLDDKIKAAEKLKF